MNLKKNNCIIYITYFYITAVCCFFEQHPSTLISQIHLEKHSSDGMSVLSHQIGLDFHQEQVTACLSTLLPFLRAEA